MLFRFSVISFIDRKTRLGVVGSVPELGLWKPQLCIPLLPYHVNIDESEPSMWSGVVDINIEVFEENKPKNATLSVIEYKFVRWKVDDPLDATNESSIFPLKLETAFPLPSSNVLAKKILPPDLSVIVCWEDLSNRKIEFLCRAQPNTILEKTNTTTHTTHHYFCPERNFEGIYKNEYILPVVQFRDYSGSVQNEASHTTRSYHRIKDLLRIHFNQILNRVYVGTCPRKKEHILYLHEQKKISDVMNFQTAEDIIHNFPITDSTGIHKSPEYVAELYKSLGIRYTWCPMADLNSVSKAQNIAQTIVLLASLLKRKDCTGVYVHCNAGVGRSIACVSGYIHCILGISLRLTNFIVNARRPVGYFDEDALEKAAEDFHFKFEGVVDFLRAN